METRTPQIANQEADADGTIDLGIGPSTSTPSEHQKLHEVDDDDEDDDDGHAEENRKINNETKNNHGTSSSSHNDQSLTNNNNNITSRKNMMLSNETNADAMMSTMGTAPSRVGVGATSMNGGNNSGGGGGGGGMLENKFIYI